MLHLYMAHRLWTVWQKSVLFQRAQFDSSNKLQWPCCCSGSLCSESHHVILGSIAGQSIRSTLSLAEVILHTLRCSIVRSNCHRHHKSSLRHHSIMGFITSLFVDVTQKIEALISTTADYLKDPDPCVIFLLYLQTSFFKISLLFLVSN
jgi:hypothetical protein